MEDSLEGGVSTRTMKLKVLYTFDTEHKHNHLARWPHNLDIQTALIDEINQIGVVDLRTCLEAIATASPEITSTLEQDYTVYAYDYSEPDSPLVGQGLLSNALSDHGSDEEADDDAGNMVTGRVTKNAMGLFTKNATETLEVKIRLTPVSSSLRNDERQRRYSSSATNADAFPRSASPMDTSGLEAMHQMLGESNQRRGRSNSQAGDSFARRPASRPSSRSGTPIFSQSSDRFTRQPTHASSRPSSRAGMRLGPNARRDSMNFDSGFVEGDDNQDEGPPKKRAKVTKVEIPGKNSFNIERQPDSLRVVASTASSVRLHRPTPVNPALALQTGTSAEEPIRPPTPIPNRMGRMRDDVGRSRTYLATTSNLHMGSATQQSSPVMEHARPLTQFVDSSAPSPEDGRAGSISSTPANFPSSPPVMHDNAPQMTSPGLPALAGADDSKFMVGEFDDIFGDTNMVKFDDFLHADNNVPGHDTVYHNGQPDDGGFINGTYLPVFEEESQNVAPVPIDPALFQDNQSQTGSAATGSESFRTMPNSSTILAPPPFGTAPSIRSETRTGIAGQPRLLPAIAAQLPPMPRDTSYTGSFSAVLASDPVGGGNWLHRSNTWAGTMSDLPEPATEALTADDSNSKKPAPKKRGREQTRRRLENAISTGGMPPYCYNCGAIHTPAWRRAWAKEFDCPFDDIETSLEEGGTVFKEITTYNEDGSARTTTGYKLQQKPEDKSDDWTQINLCNPCGLWIHKSKTMRPPEKWAKEKGNGIGTKKGRPRIGRKPKASSGKNPRSDAPTPASDGSSPPDDAAMETAQEEDRNAAEDMNRSEESQEPELPSIQRSFRSNSVGPTVKDVRHRIVSHNATMRAVRSSPVRAHGAETVPIDVDLTPHPLRRQLFPSPEKGHSQTDVLVATSSGDIEVAQPSFMRRSPRLNKTKDVLLSLDNHGPVDQENLPGPVDDGLDGLFNGSDDDVQLPPPTTPTPTRRSERLFFKTPGKTAGRSPLAELSTNAQRKSNNQHPAVAALLGTATKVAEMTPFTRQIHEALSDTPTLFGHTSPTAATKLRTPRKVSPKTLKAMALDFPDLPSLGGSSPFHNPAVHYGFSELTTDQMGMNMTGDYMDVFSTDAVMSSSPPPGGFGNLLHDDTGLGNIWAGLDMTGMEEFIMPAQTDGAADVEVGRNPPKQLRRSPRKKT